MGEQVRYLMAVNGSFLKHQSVRCQSHVSREGSQDQGGVRQGEHKGGEHIVWKRGARQEWDYAHQEGEGEIVHNVVTYTNFTYEMDAANLEALHASTNRDTEAGWVRLERETLGL